VFGGGVGAEKKKGRLFVGNSGVCVSSERKKKMEETKVVYAEAKYVVCPYCAENNVAGVDPIGETITCYQCKNDFKVSEYADVLLES
jgi:hypothetical protein